MKFLNKYSDKCHAEPDINICPSMTNAELGFECDINNIVNGYTHTSFAKSDFSSKVGGLKFSPEDYQNAVYELAKAKSLFEELPSQLRQKFHNRPEEMLQFISDSKNTEECIKLGLMKRIEKDSPIEVSVVNTPQVSPDEIGKIST